MNTIPKISTKTHQNWWLDAALFLSGIIATISGVYFLFFTGGYQGGRNPLYDVTILMTRSAWDLWHTWTGMLMIAIATIHIVLHWNWIARAVSRTIKTMLTGQPRINGGAWMNIFINAVTGLSFLVTAVSGVYFMFFPGGPSRVETGLLFSRTTWDMLHTWGGVVLVLSGVAHFYIHWRWVVKVSRSVMNSLLRPFGKARELSKA